MNNQEIYYRNVNIPFKILKFTKKDINTRIETPLNFYQKYITILLKEGLNANNVPDLINYISNMLNIKKAIVENYINTLDELGALSHKDNKYYLANNTYFGISENNPKILVANIKEGNDQLDFIYMIESGNLLSRNILERANINLGTMSEFLLDSTNIISNIMKKEDIAKEVSQISLNKVLSRDFCFTGKDFEKLESSTVHIPVRVEYIYDRVNGHGVYSNCEINNSNDVFNKYLTASNIDLKVKSVCAVDDRKPDYILLEEHLKREKEQLEKIKQEEIQYRQVEEEQEKTDNTIISLNDKIEEKNVAIKSLKSEIRKLKDNSAEYENKEKEYNKILDDKNKDLEKYEQDNEDLKAKLKESNIKLNKIREDKKKYKEQISEMKKQVEVEHQKIIKDEFDRKLENYRLLISKIDDNKYNNLYKETKLIYDTLLSFYKKLNDDSRNLKDEWFNLYNTFTVYAKVIVSYLLNRKPETSDSINNLIDDFNSTDLATKFGIQISTLKNLKQLERIVDNGRHKFDSIQHKGQNEQQYLRSNELFSEFIKSSTELKKTILYSVIEIFEKPRFKEEDFNQIESLLLIELEKSSTI